jgi:dolichol-phosphate mannosyltransferase
MQANVDFSIATETRIENQESIQNQWTTVLSVIVPTRNESGNVKLLLDRLAQALKDTPLEVIFVDDSSDDTPQVIQAHAQDYSCLEIKLIHREADQRTGGLSGAVVEGMRHAQSPWVCVMDGDLQHPPEIIPQMFEKVQREQADLILASRRAEGGQANSLGVFRDLVSRGLDGVARILFPKALHNVSDPLTGFFIVRMQAIDPGCLRPKGFKILLEILVRHPELKKSELPFQFGSRFAGKSKASTKEVLRYLNLLASLRFGEDWARPVGFGLVGLTGIFVNTLFMWLFTSVIGLHYLISAAFGTAASTTWNFFLTEFWVFNSRQMKSGRVRRFFSFSALNVLALLARAPMIYAFTAFFGFFYLVSNLITLVILFVVRYLISARHIWGGTESPSAPTPVVANEKMSIAHPNRIPFSDRRKHMREEYFYNLHDIVSITSEGYLPELSPFRVAERIEKPDILVRIGNPQRSLPSLSEVEQKEQRSLHYREMFGSLGFEAVINIGEKVEVIASPILRYSPHVLYTNLVEPILRWRFVEKGYALVHGATIAYGNEAYMITARTDTGKTTTILKILNQQRRETDKAAFISDDMTLVSPDGKVLSYPKPLTISHHTMRAVNREVLSSRERLGLFFQSRIHSRSGRKMAFVMGKSKLPMATINTIVQWLVPPPKYPIQRLVPEVKFAPSERLAGLFIIERGGEEKAMPIDKESGLEVLLRNCEDAYGFPPYESIKEFLYCVHGNDLRESERVIIQKAFESLPITLVQSSHLDWWRRIPGYVDQDFARYFGPANDKESLYKMRTEAVVIRR